MSDLIKSRLIKYIHSPLLYIAMIVSLVTGIENGIYCTYFKDEAKTVMNCPTDDMWFLCGQWAAIILVALCSGREFSDRTICNKMVSGHSRSRVYFSEIISAVIMVFPIYLLNIIPTAVGGWYFIAGIPVFSAVRWFVDIFLSFELMSIISVTVTYLIGKRALGVVAAFAIHFLLYCMVGVTEGYYYNLYEPKTSTHTVYITYDDGRTETREEEFENGYYIEGFSRTLVKAEHAINPMYGLVDTVQYGYILDQSEADERLVKEGNHREWLLNFSFFKTLGYCFFVSAVGALLFRKKNLK